jgi:hypothetical protein
MKTKNLRKLWWGMGVMGIAFFLHTSAAENSVYISQVQITGGTGKTTEDFVELFNPTSEPYNLKGRRLVKRTKEGTSDTTLKAWSEDAFIPARGFYLWANSSLANFSVVPDALTSGSIASDNGVALRLGEEDTGELVDSVSWGEANNGFILALSQNPEANQSIALSDVSNKASGYMLATSVPHNTLSAPVNPPDGGGGDTGGDGNGSTTPVILPPDEDATTTPEQSPTTPVLGGQNYLIKSPLVKISELMPNPEGEDENREMVELYNGDTHNVLLDGWLLDDKNSGQPKSGSLKLSGIISAGQYFQFAIPKGHFVLNNSGGDELSLYFADKILADKVVYQESAPEGLSYQKLSGGWLWQQPSFGLQNTQQALTLQINENFLTSTSSQATGTSAVLLNEIMPNPEGPDDGKEWVEFYNPSANSVSLKNYYLDDGDEGGISEKPFFISDNFIVPPGGYRVLSLPEEAFALNNTGKERLKFFDPGKKLLQSAQFENVPEGKTWARGKAGDWQVAIPTYEKLNSSDIPLVNLVISEISPNPGLEGDEFIELFNPAADEVSLQDFVLRVGNAKKVLPSGSKIGPQSYLAVFEEDLPVRLRNTGQTVVLEDALGRQIYKAEYPKTLSGNSYSLGEDGKYVWTSSITPQAPNEFVLGESEKSDAKKTVSSTKSASASTKKLESEIARLTDSNRQLSEQLVLLQSSMERLSLAANPGSAKLINDDFQQNETSSGSSQEEKKANTLRYFLLSGVSLGLLAFFARKGLKSVL